MTLGMTVRMRSLRRYRMFFRVTVVMFLLSIVFTAQASFDALAESRQALIAACILLLATSALYCYRIVSETAKLIFDEDDDRGMHAT